MSGDQLTGRTLLRLSSVRSPVATEPVRPEQLAQLGEFFTTHPQVALGFSGGVDSAYLLYAGMAAGAHVRAYFIKTAFRSRADLDDAQRLASQLDADLQVVEHDLRNHPEILSNSTDRCYHCKSTDFSLLRELATAAGVPVLIDGTNASDDATDRPGITALQELGVRSPLREAGFTKAQVRQASKDAGLFTWNKPANACLATRIPYGTRIDAELLGRVEAAEAAVAGLGFSDLRVRTLGRLAKLQLPDDQLARAVELRAELVAALRPYFDDVVLDLRGR